MKAGAESSVSLVRWYLKRIEKIDRRGPNLRSVIELNSDALEIARALDRERIALERDQLALDRARLARKRRR